MNRLEQFANSFEVNRHDGKLCLKSSAPNWMKKLTLLLCYNQATPEMIHEIASMLSDMNGEIYSASDIPWAVSSELYNLCGGDEDLWKNITTLLVAHFLDVL